MAFADLYLSKQTIVHTIDTAPNTDLGIVVTIPCYDEPDLISSLEALRNCQRPSCSVEVIVVVNAGENAHKEALEQNRKTIVDFYNWVNDKQEEKLKFYLLHTPNVAHKVAGVGSARKAAMDAAVYRYNILQKPEGVITGYDADSSCAPNYFLELEDKFVLNSQLEATSIHYEHPISGNDFSKELYDGIVDYELHLRYFVQAQSWAKLPFAYHTVGSSFAVKALGYVRYGGMNRKKAGEDFYFLQKFIPHGKFGNLHDTMVIPSPRPSDRVPFGTGASIRKMEDNSNFSFQTYSFGSFAGLKDLVEKKFEFYKNDFDTAKQVLADTNVVEFMEKNNFAAELVKINRHSPNKKIFEDRFHQWWNAFRTMKYLNWLHEERILKEDVGVAANNLLTQLALPTSTTKRELLVRFRVLDKQML